MRALHEESGRVVKALALVGDVQGPVCIIKHQVAAFPIPRLVHRVERNDLRSVIQPAFASLNRFHQVLRAAHSNTVRHDQHEWRGDERVCD